MKLISTLELKIPFPLLLLNTIWKNWILKLTITPITIYNANWKEIDSSYQLDKGHSPSAVVKQSSKSDA
jgi:hypothetical protein